MQPYLVIEGRLRAQCAFPELRAALARRFRAIHSGPERIVVGVNSIAAAVDFSENGEEN